MAIDIARREFILAFGGAAVAWPIAAGAQQSIRMRRMGLLVGYAENDSEAQAHIAALRETLQKLGWTANHDIQISERWASGDVDKMHRYAAELVRLNPDVIVGVSVSVVVALRNETRSIPIVFTRVLSAPLDEVTRNLLFKYRSQGGFEAVMSMLQTEYKARPTDETGRRLHDFTSAILGIFNGMNNAMLSQQFELNNDIAFSVRAFLERFDAVFTLNQDALLEAQYIPQAGSRWSGKEMPGTKSFGPASLAYGGIHDRISHRTSDIENYKTDPRFQPYFKLHGSANWIVDFAERAATHPWRSEGSSYTASPAPRAVSCRV
jgi:hypothetical protein